MVKKVIAKLKAWSYSKLSLYKQCPRKFKYTYIDKLPQPEAEPLIRGVRLHGHIEDYLKGKKKTLHKEIKHLRKQIQALKKRKVVAEEEWAFTDEWEETGWEAANAWLRMKLDTYYEIKKGHIMIIDYKTGKIRDNYFEQLDLYALAVFCMFEGINKVTVQLWFVDQPPEENNIREETYYIKRDMNKLLKYFKRQTKKLFSDKTFSPKPSWLCNYCHWSKANNKGPCKYG